MTCFVAEARHVDRISVGRGFRGKASVIPNAVRDLLFAATKKKQIPRAKFALGMTIRSF